MMRVLITLLALLLAAGCDDSSSEESSTSATVTGGSCTYDQDCGAHEICVEGECVVQECSSVDDCGLAEACPAEWDEFRAQFNLETCHRQCNVQTLDQPICQAHSCNTYGALAQTDTPLVDCADDQHCVEAGIAGRCVSIGDGLGCRSDGDCSGDLVCDIRGGQPEGGGACAERLP